MIRIASPSRIFIFSIAVTSGAAHVRSVGTRLAPGDGRTERGTMVGVASVIGNGETKTTGGSGDGDGVTVGEGEGVGLGVGPARLGVAARRRAGLSH